MTVRSHQPLVGSTERIVLGALMALVISVAVNAGQTPAPATPAAPAPQTPAAPGGRGGPTNLAPIPGTPWRIHDAARPQPRVVTPGATVADPPSDAIVLFNGKDLSKWDLQKGGQTTDATWPVKDGYFEVGPGSGSIYTRENFGDVQLHLEFAEPVPVTGNSQGRGNSGVKFMGIYEIEILDAWQNPTYADGVEGAIYGEQPPLVNASKKPGEWQVFDLFFEAPKFNGATLVAPAYVTVIWNGVLVQHRRAIMGNTSPTTTPHTYTAHAAELPIMLQDHGHPVRFRNIWVRRLTGYDQP
ncbi:MAG: DUF1080 domain-containing protein [Vicinamibacterales bacterium]